MISGEEAFLRIRILSELRDLTLGLKYSAIEAFDRGELRYKPKLDIRSDYEYWKEIAHRKGIPIKE